MPSLGSLWYGVMLKDMTDADLQKIENKLKNLGVSVDTRNIRSSIEASIGAAPFNATLAFGKAQASIDAALAGAKGKANVEVIASNLRKSIGAALENYKGKISASPKKKELRDAVQAALLSSGFRINIGKATGVTLAVKNALGGAKDLKLNVDTKKLADSINRVLTRSNWQKLSVEAKKKALTDSIRTALKTEQFPIKVIVNKAEAQDAVRQALKAAGLQSGFSASDKRAWDAQSRRIEAEARAAAQGALAQRRLARSHMAAQRATDSHIHSSISLGSAMRGNIRIAGELGPMLASAYSIVTLKNFMQKVVEIGGELEQQKLAMKAILGDEGMANTITSQINALAVKSPFGVMELNQYAKQLTAFQIPYNELYDTMKRMADVSAAVGVDMGRIILAYGQVRAAKFLKGTELRQFTEANIPLIDMLAQRFTKLKGEMVSAGDIMDMISKKEISFEVVKAVLWELTGEGGRFYNMQEVLSESVKAKWKNLADAVDLMFADITNDTSGALKGLAELLTSLTSQWATIATVVGYAAIAFGASKLAIMVLNRGLANSTVNAIKAAESQAMLERRNLQLAQSYRVLTAAEKRTLANPTRGFLDKLTPWRSSSALKSLTDEQTKQLILSRQIKKEEWLRLAAMDKLTQRQKAALVVYGGITREELRSLRNLKGMNLLWAKIRYSAASVGRSIAGFLFSPVTILMTLVSVLTSLWQKNNEEMERAKEFGKELITQGSEASKNISQALKAMPKDISGTSGIQTLEKLRQLIKDYSSIPDKILDMSQFKDDGTIRTTAEQIAYLSEQLVKLKEANDALSEKGEDYGAIVKATNGGWFDDDVITDINDWAESVENAKAQRIKFVAENKKTAEAIVNEVANFDPAFKKATEGMDSLIDKFNELFSGNYTIPNKYKGILSGGFWGHLGLKDSVMSTHLKVGQDYNEMRSEIKSVAEIFKESHKDWDWSKLDTAQEEIIRKYFNGLIQKADKLGPWARQMLQSIISEIIGFDMSGMSGELMIANEMRDKLPDLLGKELADKVIEGLPLTPDEQNRVNKAIQDTYFKMFANADKFGKEALTKAVSKDGKVIDLTKMSGITARMSVTADWDAWQRDLYKKFGGHPTIRAWVNAAPDYLSFVEAVKDGYKKAKSASDLLNQNPIIVKAKLDFGFKNNELLPEDNAWFNSLDEAQKKAVKEYNANIRTIQDAQSVATIEGINLSTNNRQSDTQKDTFADKLKQRFKDIKDAWSEFQKWQKTEGREAAAKRIGESGLFSTLSVEQIPQTVEQYRALVVQLENELRKAGVKGTARESLLNDLLKQLLDIDKTVIDEQLKLALDKVSKEAERQLADWQLFDKIRKATGNQDLAMSIAFGLNADAVTDYPSMIKQQLKKTVDAAESALSKAVPKDGESPYAAKGYTFEQLKALYDARDTDQGMQTWMAVPEEIRKAWEKANSDILKYFDQQREAVANILNEYQTLQDKIDAINAKRKTALETINAKDKDGNFILSEEERAKRTTLVNTEADYDIFTKSNDYLRFFNDIYGLTLSEANRIGDLIQLNLNQKLQAGLITIYDYEKEMEKVRKQLEALRNVKSDAMTFMTGGVKGLNAKRLQKAEGELANNKEYQAALANQVAAQKALNEAQAEGNEEKIKTAEEELKLANESLKVYTKVRDTIVKNEKDWQNVADVTGLVANIAGGLSDAFNTVRDMADSLGFDTDSNAWNTAAAVIDTFSTVSSGVSKIVQSTLKGDIGGIISGTFDTVLTPITIWSKLHDKKMQKIIDKSKEYAEVLQRINDSIERRMTHFLGNARYMIVGQAEADLKRLNELNKQSQKSLMARVATRAERDKLTQRANAYREGGAYGYERQLMTEQLAELEKQRQAELDKKKTDNNVVADYDAQIDEMKVKIRDFAEETANTLYGIDLKGWASQISDALVDAFAKGEDAAEAFNKVVASIMRSVVSKVISVGIIEPMMKNLQTWLFGDDGGHGAFGADFELQENEIAELGKRLKDMEGSVGKAKELYDKINELTGGMLDDEEKSKSGTSAGIQSITENTADLLASYINAIRASVAMNEGRWERLLGESLPQISVIAQSQLDAQRQIAENTLRNAIAAESVATSSDAINRLLIKVTMGASKFNVK